MAKGENIFKRRDGHWEARYVKGRELSGKIKYGFCYGKTYREAKDKVTKIKAELLSGKMPSVGSSKHRFSFYCGEWLRFKRDGVRESTYIKYEAILQKHIEPKLGACFPTGISGALVEEFTHELLAEDALCENRAGYSERFAQRYEIRLEALSSAACADRYKLSQGSEKGDPCAVAQ